MIEEVGSFRISLKQPSPYEISTRVLKAKVDDIDKIKAAHMTAWKEYGCTGISDEWMDRKGKSLINFLVNSPEGTFFYKSIDVSESIKIKWWQSLARSIFFKWLSTITHLRMSVQDLWIQENTFVGLLTAHCLDLMPKDINKMKIHKETLETTKDITQFLYNHGCVLNLFQTHMKGQERLRPAITWFATSFLTLQILYQLRQPLRKMFASEKLIGALWPKKLNGVKAKGGMLSTRSFQGQSFVLL